MRRFITRTCAVAAAGVVCSALGIAEASAKGATTQAPRQATARLAAVASAAAAPGTRLWVKRWNDSANGYDAANSAAVSPAGNTVVVTGESGTGARGQNFATIAYNTATGAQRWAAKYNGPANGDDRGNSVAISPDGTRVFVTGTSLGRTSDTDFATIAYNSLGARLWVSRYNGPANKADGADDVVVSPDGKKIFVSGTSRGGTSGDDYVTVAYNAATGAQLWVKRYNGTGNGDDWAFSMAVNPAGTRVYVTGTSMGKTSDLDIATIAYKAATGGRLWVKRYNGPGNSVDVGFATGVSINGSTVFVTGQSEGRVSGTDFTTVAYNATTGAQRWVKRYSHYNNNYYEAGMGMAVSPTGKSVVVTGTSGGADTGGYVTIAYNPTTGAQQWAKRYTPAGGGAAFAAAFSPDGSKVYITGGTGRQAAGNYGTLSYKAASGARLWVKTYNGPAHGEDNAASVAVSPSGNRVFVTGRSTGTTSGFDYATIAYRG